MGTVRIKIKITNAIDEGMARRGQLEATKVRNCEVCKPWWTLGRSSACYPPFSWIR